MKRFSFFICLVILAVSCSKKNDNNPTNPGIVVPDFPDTLSPGWTKVGSFQIEDMSDVFFTDFSHGYVAASGGIYNSNDGGITWSKVKDGNNFINIGAKGSSASFVNVTSTMYNSLNYGQTIQEKSYSLSSGASFTFKDCFYTSADVCYAASGIYMWKSVNGGTSFDTLYNFNDVGSTSLSLFFTDEQHGWVSRNYSLYKTIDGGIHWTSIKTLVNVTGGVYFIDNNNGYITDGARLYRTTDAGVTWQGTANIFDNNISDIHFISPAIGFCCAGTEIFKTTDSGNSWTRVVKLGQKNIIEIHFLDDHHGWACGHYGYVLRFNL